MREVIHSIFEAEIREAAREEYAASLSKGAA